MFELNIDHVQFMAQVASFWEFIDYQGIASAIINIASGALVALVFWRLFHNADDPNEQED
jgi:hypothetical protein